MVSLGGCLPLQTALCDYLSTKDLKRKGGNLFSDTKWTQQGVTITVGLENKTSGFDRAKEKENGL